MTQKIFKMIPTIDLKINFFEDEKLQLNKDFKKHGYPVHMAIFSHKFEIVVVNDSRNLGTEQNTVKFSDVANLYYSTATETHSFVSAGKEK